MLSGDKRASLSSNLLDGKDTISTDGAVAGPQHRSNAAKSDGKLRDTVLYNKGAASASGFRPRQWSYDAQLQADDEAGTVTPFPTSASLQRTPAANEAAPTNSRARMAMIGLGAFSAIALIASVSLFVLSRSHDGGTPAAMPVASAPAPVVPVPSAAPPAAVVASTPTPAAAAPAAPAGETVALAEPQPENSHRTEASPLEETAAAPPPTPAAASASQQMAPEEIKELVNRGAKLLATGDIAAARVFFERAAEQGSAAAATAAGKTYDPLYLEEAHVRGIRGDPVTAAKWYRRASAAGDKEADLRMQKLIARYAG